MSKSSVGGTDRDESMVRMVESGELYTTVGIMLYWKTGIRCRYGLLAVNASRGLVDGHLMEDRHLPSVDATSIHRRIDSLAGDIALALLTIIKALREECLRYCDLQLQLHENGRDVRR